jgi:UPF0755 protein
MIKEYRKFWNKERVAKGNKGLTPIEATIFSIVHKESVKKDERPRIAGLLEPLKVGNATSSRSDGNLCYKKEANDFEQIIKRVLYNDLTMVSPYNTYMNTGLPPGPIVMPDITLEVVLNPEKNDFIYFCASVDRFGYHEFA